MISDQRCPKRLMTNFQSRSSSTNRTDGRNTPHEPLMRSQSVVSRHPIFPEASALLHIFAENCFCQGDRRKKRLCFDTHL